MTILRILTVVLVMGRLVHVSGAFVNVARNKPVNMSSLFGLHTAATKGVDGITNANFIHTAFDKTDAWWWVDLQTQVQDATVTIYFRTDSKIRRNGLQLYTSMESFSSSPDGDLCYTFIRRVDGTDIPDVVSVTCNGTWRYLMVYTNISNEESPPILDFAELEVLVCINKTYGKNCTLPCGNRKCANSSSSCSQLTGECEGGCQPGWKEISCTQDCTNGTYGRGCNNTCDPITGKCDGGCKAGWSGADCTQTCMSGKYGEDCKMSCLDRKCKVASSSCNHTSGKCDRGCQPGWNGTDCTQICVFGKYGQDCNMSCKDRKCEDPSPSCNHTSGKCDRGCQPGWNGTDCIQKCPNGTFGPDCFNCNIRHCQGESDCLGDGTCSDGCQDGWTLDNCTQVCIGGTYGKLCNYTCGNCAENAACDHGSGKCLEGCDAGFLPDTCHENCPSGSYDVNCVKKCGHCKGTCNRIDGHCPGGCEEGYSGAMCDISIGYYAAGAAAFVLVIVVVVVLIVCICRRKHCSPKERSGEENNISTGNNVYMNVGASMEKPTKTEKPSVAGQHSLSLYKRKSQVSVHKRKSQPSLHSRKSQLSLHSRKSQLVAESGSSLELEEEILDEVESPSSRDYYNESEDVIREIAVTDLAATIQKIQQREGGFEAEYHRLPTGFTAPYDDSQKPENSGKNKYKGYYPYDHNRVRLSLHPDTPGSDYINASFMHSYDQKKAYIGAQAPNKKTVGDFWRMIWEHRCNRVIMVTGLVEGATVKCYQYWPAYGSMNIPHYKVDVEAADIRANYTVRYLKVTQNVTGECRSVVQYHYTSWPDHGVPDTLALSHFIWMIRRTDTPTDGPLLVHCSAGIGRTGTYIAIDSLLDQARNEGMVDVQGYVSVMRGQRKNMIQTQDQYECVFHCLLEMTKYGDTSMDVGDFSNSYNTMGMDGTVNGHTFRDLSQEVTRDVSTDPPNGHRLWVDGNKDFTVTVGPTPSLLTGFLLAKTPPPELERLLWKMVEENKVYNIIAVSPLPVEFFGEKGKTKTFDGITVTTTCRSQTADLSIITLKLETKNERNFRCVKMFLLGGTATVDNMSLHLLNHGHLQHLSAEMSPIALIHRETDRKCAVSFCIMGNILAGMLEDHRVDVIGHVRSFCKCTPDLRFTEKEIEDFHNFAKKCIALTETANAYANL